MKKIHLSYFLAIVFCGVSWVVGFGYGVKVQARREFSLSVANVNACEEGRAKEYFKARVYTYSSYVPDDWLGASLDSGPVDDGLVAGLAVIEDAYDLKSEYAELKRRISAASK